MTRDHNDYAADLLLSACERDVCEPFYRNESFNVKLRRSHRRDLEIGETAMSKPFDPLLRTECLDVFANANLTARQMEIVEQWLDGWSYEEIGQASGHTRQAAQRVFTQALKKLRAAYRVYPLQGMSEVYHQLTHRQPCSGRFGKLIR